MKTVLDCLIQSLKKAASHNPDAQEAPHCILWPDKDRQWEPAISKLQGAMPELLMFGKFAPEKRSGPAIWLRCALARKLEEVVIPRERMPILYLPGISKQDLRAIEECPSHLKPLAELQYRGTTWSQVNGKDWTILAFLVAESVPDLSLDVASDQETKTSIQLSLSRLLDVESASLKEKRLDKDFFNTLLTSGDPTRDLLTWLNDSDLFRKERDEAEWKGFAAICRSQFGFDPDRSSTLDAAFNLASHKGAWRSVWERFSEGPQHYPSIPTRLRACKRPSEIFESAETMGGWPQWNDEQESRLRLDLLSLSGAAEHVARKRIIDLEKIHGERRSLVWSGFGESNLAIALQHLALIAEVASDAKWSGTIDDLTAAYSTRGWLADDALLLAIQAAESTEEQKAVGRAINAVYHPWAENAARTLQSVVEKDGYKKSHELRSASHQYPDGTCVLFVDGLRFDVGKRLATVLSKDGFAVAEVPSWVALPSVTATGKAAVSPVAHKIAGMADNCDFEPCVAATGQSLKGGYHLRKLLEEEGWQYLKESDCGSGEGLAWLEFGNIDSEGHQRGSKLAKHIDDLLREIAERIEALLRTGWKVIHVVTDHGWLLLPGGLPKSNVEMALFESRWGRCASLKEGASNQEGRFPWYWNAGQSFVLANGISCFRNGEEYSHGGLSFQECLTLQLEVRSLHEQRLAAATLTIISWKGLRCIVAVDGQPVGAMVDVRLFAGDPSSSVALKVSPVRDDGTSSVVVDDDEMDDRDAVVILTDADGKILAQSSTVIGGGK